MTFLELSERFSVIPCGADKRPMVASWKPYQAQRPTEQELSQWAARNPAAWAAITGAVSGLVILDFDGDAGADLLESLDLKAHVQTPSGGFHVYVKHPGFPIPTLNGKAKEELGAKWPGLDIRGDGGYAISCGHNSAGEYRWLRSCELLEWSDVPEDLREWIEAIARRNQERATVATGPASVADGKIPEGKRHGALTSFAARLFNAECRESEGLAALRQFNRDRFDKPKPDSELVSIVEWTWKQERGKPKSGPARGDAPEVVNGADLLSDDSPAPEPIVRPILFDGATVFGGRPKSGKSWFALQAALSVVTGDPLAGWFQVDRPGKCLYLALEEPQRRTAQRMKQLLKMGQADALEQLHLVYSIEPLMNGGAVKLDRLMESIEPRLVIVDTWYAITRQSARRDGDIVASDYQTAAMFTELAQNHSCGILIVHHTTKHSGNGLDSIQGTSGTTAAMDAVWTLARKNDGTAILECVGREFEMARFELSMGSGSAVGWTVTGEGDEVGYSEERKDILTVLRDEEPMSLKDLASRLRKPYANVKRLVYKMTADGSLRKQGGKYAAL